MHNIIHIKKRYHTTAYAHNKYCSLKLLSTLLYFFYLLFSNKQFASFAGAKPRNHSAPVDLIRTATAGDEF